MRGQRDPSEIPGVLRGERARDDPLLDARPGQGPDAAVHQRRHGPVQGRLPRRGPARLHPRHDLAEVRPRRGQAQRPGERRAHRAPPHLLRDARQLLLRRLLQGRRHRLRLGVPDEDHGPAEGPPLGHRLPRRRRGRGALAEDRGPAARAGRPARREGQLLADGGHRPLRPLQRDPDRPGAVGRLRAARVRRRLRLRPLPGDLEPGLHAVQPRRRRHADAAAQAEHRHGHGPRAPGRRRPGEAEQLRHRPVRAAARRSSPGPAAKSTARMRRATSRCGSSPTTCGRPRS